MQFLKYLTKNFPAAVLLGLLAVAPAAEARKHKNKDPNRSFNYAPRQPVSPEVFDDLELYAHFAAAVYCSDNAKYEPDVKKQMACDMTRAPCVLAENEDTLVMYAWDNVGPFRLKGNVVADYDREEIIVSFSGVVDRGSQFESDNDIEWELTPWGLGSGQYIGNTLMEWDIADCPGCKGVKKTIDAWKTIQDQLSYVIVDLGLPKFNKVVMVGHGQGGAMATAATLWARQKGINTTLYTYGAPRIGNEAFANYISAQGQNYRVTHKSSSGSRGPPMKDGFRHMMPEYYINTPKYGVYPTIDQVFMVPGMENHNGNGGDSTWQLTNTRNRWFFGQINRCQFNGPQDANGHWTPYLSGGEKRKGIGGRGVVDEAQANTTVAEGREGDLAHQVAMDLSLTDHGHANASELVVSVQETMMLAAADQSHAEDTNGAAPTGSKMKRDFGDFICKLLNNLQSCNI